MNDPLARGGVRRYLDTVFPEEYIPSVGEVNLSELSLRGLADLFGSDKGSIKHNYCDIYEILVSEIIGVTDRKKRQLTVAEFGVACGASLRMWSNYLPSSNIFGFDIRDECKNLCQDLKNCEIIIEDVTQIESHHNREKFDLIIDDASHISEEIVAAFNRCWSWVKPGGFYVIEDLSCTYNEQYTQKFREHFNASVKNDRNYMIAFFDQLFRSIDSKSTNISNVRYYPQLLVIQKLP